MARGGQGAVTSVELLAVAAIGAGKYAQGFPSFGPERRGAPVAAFSRIDEKKIKVRSGIYRAGCGGCAGFQFDRPGECHRRFKARRKIDCEHAENSGGNQKRS